MTRSTFEKQLNFVIANGDRIAENGLGTILPDKKSLKQSDRHFDKQNKISEKKADNQFSGLNKKIVGGETRYYLKSNIYCTVKGHWFETKKDGDYSIPNPRK
jgi:hypothetical protein